MRCPRCGFIHDRDVIGAMNLARKYLLDVGLMPLAPKGAHDPPCGVVCDHNETWGRSATRPSET